MSQCVGENLVEAKTRARQTQHHSDLARATLFIGGMYCPDCPATIRTSLSNLKGVVEVLVTNYVETPYGVAQIFYDSAQVSRDEILTKITSPYWATLIEDKDPKREQILQRYTDIYVC
jgi:copper chaperone CopZ